MRKSRSKAKQGKWKWIKNSKKHWNGSSCSTTASLAMEVLPRKVIFFRFQYIFLHKDSGSLYPQSNGEAILGAVWTNVFSWSLSYTFTNLSFQSFSNLQFSTVYFYLCCCKHRTINHLHEIILDSPRPYHSIWKTIELSAEEGYKNNVSLWFHLRPQNVHWMAHSPWAELFL